MTWATEAETLTYTGETVDASTLTQAQGIIELLAGTTEAASDAGNIGSTNLRLLKQAVAYQAAWIVEHPDTFTSMDLTRMAEGSGSGMAIDLANTDAMFLAPLARVALGQLSWKATRSVRVRPGNARARRRIERQYRGYGFDECGPGEWRAI